MRKVSIPWGCWRGSKSLPLTFPNNWKIAMAPMADKPDVSQEEIRKAFQNPIGQEPIRKIAEGKKTAAIAVDALGKEGVAGVAMPSPYSSKASLEDARLLAKNLGIRFLTIPISEIFQAYLNTLSTPFKGLKANVAEENIQARIRGNILMALSNKFGWLVLTTGNKSEVSVGYCTLYGDMAGGFAVLRDVLKTRVYELAQFKNERAGRPVIPQNVFTKPPSAELRPNQKDEDSLPPAGRGTGPRSRPRGSRCPESPGVSLPVPVPERSARKRI